MIGTTAHFVSGEDAPTAFAIAGVVSAKSILAEFARSNDKAFWANFFLETGIATLLITKYQDEIVAAFSLAIQLITEIYQTIGMPQPLVEMVKAFGEFPTEILLLLTFLIITHRSLGLLVRRVFQGVTTNLSSDES